MDCTDYFVGKMAGSDHSQVTVTLSISIEFSLHPIYKRCFNKLNYNEFMLRASKINLNPTNLNPPTPDSLLSNWEEAMFAILDDLAPYRQLPFRRKRIPYLTPEVYELMRYRNF